jgi:predicted RNase H-like HicB family nuclease
MNTYTYTVMVAKGNGGYRVLCPALPGCRAYGNTRKEALQNIEIAITHRLEVLAKKGKPVPREKDPA